MTRELVVAESPRGRVMLGAAAVTTVVRRSAGSVDGVRVRRARRAVDVTIDGVHP